MQKDFIISTVRSVEINPSGLNDIITVPDIQQTVIHYMNGSTPATLVIEGGYLDVGIKDTMKDLIVNCIGAVVFSIIGVLYIKNRGKGKVAASFIPQMKTQEEIEADKMKRKNKK